MMHVLPVGWVEPLDISNAVVFAASDGSRYITGTYHDRGRRKHAQIATTHHVVSTMRIHGPAL